MSISYIFTFKMSNTHSQNEYLFHSKYVTQNEYLLQFYIQNK